MSLRRVLDHAREGRWVFVALDFFIVVFGVFLGLQLQEWGDARADRRRGVDFEQRLLADLAVELETYEREHRYYTAVHDYAREALALYQSEEGAYTGDFVIAAYNATQFTYTLPQRTTFDEMVSTGSLNLLRDRSLSDTAVSFYQLDARERISDHVRGSAYRENVRRLMPYRVQEAIRGECGDVLDENGYTLRLSTGCTLSLSETDIAATVAALRAHPQFEDDLRLLLSFFNSALIDVAQGHDFLLRGTEKLEGAPLYRHANSKTGEGDAG